MEVSEHLNPTSTEPCSGSDRFSSAPHHWRDNLIVFNVTPAEMESLYLFVLIKKGCLCSEGKAEHKIKCSVHQKPAAHCHPHHSVFIPVGLF